MTTYEHALITRSASGTELKGHGVPTYQGSPGAEGGIDHVWEYLVQLQDDRWVLVTVEPAGPEGTRYWLRREKKASGSWGPGV